jgi:hypothetical protein
MAATDSCRPPPRRHPEDPRASGFPAAGAAVTAASGLATVLQAAMTRGDLAGGREAAEHLVALTTRTIDKLGQVPQGDPAVDGELWAALKVFRNGAFAYRSLAASGKAASPALGAACRSLLAQGHQHADAARRLSEHSGSPPEPGPSA